jgi:hypothetical protein
MYEKLPLSLRKALYPLQLKIRAIRQRRLDKIASSAMTRALDTVASREPAIRKHLFYGASAINSKHLVTWYIFQTDRELETARENGLTSNLDTLTRSELVKRGYPEKMARNLCLYPLLQRRTYRTRPVAALAAVSYQTRNLFQAFCG